MPLEIAGSIINEERKRTESRFKSDILCSAYG